MEILLLPVELKKDLAVSKLRKACNGARSIMEVIRYWTAKGGQMVVSRNRDLPFPCLGLLFEISSRVVAIGNLPLKSLEVDGSPFEKLNEQVDYFCDTDGYRPQVEWFLERNQRLNIGWDARRHVLLAPSAALPELLVSYAQTESGYAEIFPGAEGDLAVRLLYLDEERMVGWYENLLVIPG